MKKQNKKLFVLIIIISLILFLLFFIFNSILRKEISLNSNNINSLEKIFPSEHINNIKIYQGGLFSIGSTKTICESIYFRKISPVDFNSSEDLSYLVHETLHTYQSKTTARCIKMSVSSLYNQFISFLKTGTRDNAYFYTINSISDYNPEQEATIVEDYYYLNFLDGDSDYIKCLDCEALKKKEITKQLEIKTKNILEKYR